MKELKTGWFALATLITILVVASTLIPNHSLVSAQNAGTTGTFTLAQKVTYTAGVSQIFNNIGQSAHFLTYCNSGFIGSIDLEESFDGLTNWTPMNVSQYITADSNCHVLQAGGYFQNIRSVLVTSAGSTTASYTASTGPVTTPVGFPTIFSCNRSATGSGASSSTVTAIPAPPAGNYIHVCAVITTGSSGTVTNGNTLTFQDGTSGTCAAPGTTEWLFSPGSGQTTIPMGSGTGQLFQTTSPGQPLCMVVGNIGATQFFSLSYLISNF